MTKEFNNVKEIEKYYNENLNGYNFEEDGEDINIVINFDLFIEANIYACDINAKNINAKNIYAHDINACDINANDIIAYDINACYINANDIRADDIIAKNIKAKNISYHGICVAYDDITCKSIEGRRLNAVHFVLDGGIFKEEINTFVENYKKDNND